MKYYATLLDLDAAEEFSLEEQDLFDPLLQESNLHRIMCGSGTSEQDALQNAVENLVHEGILEICKCEDGVEDILTQIPGKQALRHVWIKHDEYHDEHRLHPLPFHDDLVAFCVRNKLTEEVKQELESIFSTIMAHSA